MIEGGDVLRALFVNAGESEEGREDLVRRIDCCVRRVAGGGWQGR